MKINNCFGKNIANKMIAFMLAIMLLLLVGCNPNEDTPSTDDTSKPTSSQEDSYPSNDETDESASDIKETVNLDGTYTVEETVQKDIKRDDAGEVIYDGNCANLSNPVKGYADDEAEKLRNQILNAPNTEELYKITGTKYYVSPGGDDTNDGKSPEKPIRTIAAVGGLNLKAGDAVLFERGAVFRIKNSISVKSGVTYGSYGKGAKPKIYASPKPLADASAWTPTKTKNLWKAEYPYKDVGCVVFDHGKIVGYKKNKIKEINKEYDFYHDVDNGMLYLKYSGGNPGKCFESVEASTYIMMFNFPNNAENVVIDNLCLKYSSGGAIYSFLFENVYVTNCELGYMGGTKYDDKVRAGNAIGNWGGGNGWYIKNNWIYQTFDTAISPQGQLDMDKKHYYENMEFCNNLLEYNNADIEIWCDTPHTLKNLKMDRNICRFTSMGWGSRIDDGGIRGIEGPVVITSKDFVEPLNISFSGNIIDCPAREIVRWDYNSGFEKSLTMTGNKVYIKKSLRTTDLVIRNRIQLEHYANTLDALKDAFSIYPNFGDFYWYE